MFQRLKGAIDSRIAEEQARQKATPSPVSRSSSTVRRSTSQSEASSAKARKPKPKDNDGSSRAPDPSEFEGAFVIEDDSEEPSRAGTPAPANMEEKTALLSDAASVAETSVNGNERVAEKPAQALATPKGPSELPQDVRTKLKKLEMMETKYKELLRSYRIAHARAIAIEPFEKVLKEETPISSIGDPEAFREYLNQQKLSATMVMEEYRNVSGERDDYKKKFQESQKLREELASSQSTTNGEGSVATTEKTDASSIDTPSASVKSPVQSILGVFSPKQKAKATDNKDVSEEFFSYDDEIPQLQKEVKEKTAVIEGLKAKVSTLEEDLAVAQESSSGLVENLEKATRELNESKEAAAALESRQAQINAQTEEIETLKEKLQSTESRLESLQADLEKQSKEASEKISTLEGEHSTQKQTAAEALESHDKILKEHETLSVKLKTQIEELEASKASDAKRVEELLKEVESLNNKTTEAAATDSKPPAPTASPSTAEAPAATPGTGATKKKNKKKKKGGASAASESTPKEEYTGSASITPDSLPATPAMSDLQAEISRLQVDIIDKDAQIEKLQSKRKTEADLREELENMQDNFLTVGQEHVEAKDKIKELQAEKIALVEQISKLELDIQGYKRESEASEKVDADLKALTAEYEDLKSKSATLQTDLGAAQQLASSRYKELTNLRDVLHSAQPELKTLRAENASLKATKDELATRTSELRRLEAREKDLKADMASFKKQAADRETEVRTLNEKITQETNSRLRFEDQNRVAQRDLRKSEAEKIQLAAGGEKSAVELAKVQEEAPKLKAKILDLEEQVSKLTFESKGLREDVKLRGSQYKNAQEMLESMQNQTGEVTMQLKEKAKQAEDLEEELGEVQRLLSERTREGETMRRLLADVDDRADAKVREMRERMEAAIEERDRAEDEASTNGRRRAREVDELKGKIRDLEKEIKRVTDDHDELLRSEKEFKRRRDELEAGYERNTQELNDNRAAMGELRDALNGSEKQVRDAEKQRNDLRRMLDDAKQQYEKQNKEFKALQAKMSKMNDVSSRSSFETGRSGSPGPANGTKGAADYVYLKTILLQFLEQKDKKRQADLVKTVLTQLLHFDKKDQEKWIATISTK